jgi:DNA-binding NtrC family response regulator
VAPLTGLVGASLSMRKIASTIEKICRYKTNVLLLGESGTGKELVARALHDRGAGRNHLFVPLNCATLGRDILENELFGHERGAFTGANERKTGLLEMADGGTLFLDEIGEMDVATQAKLLRVLERNEFRRVGGTTKLRVDLAVIAATNRDLEQDVDAGRFREDLYYRLKVVTIVVPPLRDRPEDIPPLVETFVADFNRRNGGRIRGVSRDGMRMLTGYSWPGNVRELKNAIESAGVLASGEVLDAESLHEQLFGRLPRRAARSARLPPAPAAPSGAVTIPPGTRLVDAEREIILAAIERHPSRAEAARSLGLGLRTLYTKLRQYGVSAETAR